jgi:hypothetical protein
LLYITRKWGYVSPILCRKLQQVGCVFDADHWKAQSLIGFADYTINHEGGHAGEQ